MVPKILTEIEEPVTENQSENTCVHHWLIDPPDGPTSKGVCKLCGEEKEFENWGFFQEKV